jgi:hypothetical protein
VKLKIVSRLLQKYQVILVTGNMGISVIIVGIGFLLQLKNVAYIEETAIQLQKLNLNINILG